MIEDTVAEPRLEDAATITRCRVANHRAVLQVAAKGRAMLAGKPYDYQVDRDFPSDNMS